MPINVSSIVRYFRLGINVMKRTVGYMAFRRALSINLLPRTILDLLTGRFDTK